MKPHITFSVAFIAAAATVLLPVEVVAQALPSGFTGQGGSGSNVLTAGCNQVKTIRDWLFGIAYMLGACGLVIIAVSAFLGRFKFAHLIALGGGLFIVAAADALIHFASGGASASAVSC